MNLIKKKLIKTKKTVNTKEGTTREITGWTMLLILAILVLIIFAVFLLGRYSDAGKAVITSIKSRFIGVGL